MLRYTIQKSALSLILVTASSIAIASYSHGAQSGEESAKPVLKPLPQPGILYNNTANQARQSNPSSTASRFVHDFSATLTQLHAKRAGQFAQKDVTRPRHAASFAGLDGTRPEQRIRRNNSPLQLKAVIPEVTGHFSDTQALNLARARVFLRIYRGLIGIDDPDRELIYDKTHSLNSSEEAHLRFNQYYNNIPVWPAQLTLHFHKDDQTGLLNGAFIRTPKKPLPATPAIQETHAQSVAIKAVLPENNQQAVQLTEELIYYAPGNRPVRLAWKYNIEHGSTERWLVVIDAITGQILTKYSLIQQGSTPGSGIDLSQETRPLSIWEQSGRYYLIDTSKEMFQPGSVVSGNLPDPDTTQGAIFTFDLHNQEPEQNSLIEYIQSNAPDSGWLADGISAAYNLGLVYDYYKNKHQRNAIDGQGSSMFSIVRVGQNYKNAFWNGQAMFFGDGMPFAGALDVVAHELTHGVTQHTANLVYRDQPGALNEAMSDIFGEMVEAETKGGHPDWLMGSPPLSQPFRDMKDPHNPHTLGAPYPANMSEYVHMEDDNGGVHINSSIINHAYYLIAEGLQDAIGIHDAERIFYRTLTVHLVANSQFLDCRLAAINAAAELFGQDSPQVHTVAAGFDAVGITEGPTTPPPSGHPPVSGPDATLFTCLDPQTYSYYLCRQASQYQDGEYGVFLSTYPINGAKPVSVTGDGSIVIFINDANDLCLQPVDGSLSEQCLGYSGLINNIAISADGMRYAFTFLLDNGQPDNTITVYDDRTSRVDTFTLQAPTHDGNSVDTILYADALTFTSDGSMLFFDALNILTLANNDKIEAWSIYGLDVASGTTFFLVPPMKDLDTSYPSLSRTSDNLILFAASQPGSGQSEIYAGNLNTNQLTMVTRAAGEYSVASYNGDAEKVIFDTLDNTVPTGFSIMAQPLTNDHMTPSGGQEIWVKDGLVPTVFRIGAYYGPISSTGYYDPNTSFLHINGVQIPGAGLYTADLQLTGTNPLRFRLTDAQPIANGNDTLTEGYYDPGTGVVTLPVITVTDEYSNTVFYQVTMQMTSENNEFIVTELIQTQ